MKQYIYRGSQSSLSIGGLTFLKGIALAVALVMHEKFSKHPVIQSLVKSGELDITDALDEQPTEQVNTGQQTDYSKLTVAELKELLTAENIFFDADTKKADLVALLINAGS